MIHTISSLDTLTAHVQEFSVCGKSIDDPDNATFLTWLGQPDNCVPIFHEILNSQKLLCKVAAQSYCHVNHFDKIVLVGNNAPEGFRLTLHFWNPPFDEKQLQDELIHEHRFGFWSNILVGTLMSENYSESPDGSLFQAFRYYPEKNRRQDFHDFYEYNRNVRLKKSAPVQKREGETYSLSPPTIHRINLDRNRMCCSLVLRGPRISEFSTVYNTTYPSEDRRLNNRMFTSDELAAKISTLLKALQQRTTNQLQLNSLDDYGDKMKC